MIVSLKIFCHQKTLEQITTDSTVLHIFVGAEKIELGWC